MAEKLSIIISSDRHEALQLASMTASVAAATGGSVVFFVSMNAVLKFARDLPESERKSGGAFSQLMRGKNIPDFIDLLRQGKELGDLKVYACSMAMDVLGWDKERLADIFDDVVGLMRFLTEAEGGPIVNF